MYYFIKIIYFFFTSIIFNKIIYCILLFFLTHLSFNINIMEAPKPTPQENLISIEKEIKSEQGNNFILKIYYSDCYFWIRVEKKGKIFNDIFTVKLSITQIQENQYFKLFTTPKEILEELKERIESKNPILNEYQNNINLIILLPISKFKQIEFNLLKEDNNNITENSNNLKFIIEKLFEQIEELKKENQEIKKENQEIKKEIQEIKEKNKEIEMKLQETEKKTMIRKDNFHWINQEVNIINHSQFHSNFTPDIMLGKNNTHEYSLTEGNRNHFIEFSFIKTYFLKSIRIKVANAICTLKTFSIETIDENKNRNNIGTYFRSKYQDNSGFQEFEINQICKGIKLNLIDNWGSQNGNYILISKIDFYVSD